MTIDRGELYRRVGEILDREGIVGVSRVIYYDFALSLLRVLAKTPEEDRGKTTEALITRYRYEHMAKKTVLRKIAKALTRRRS
jgi:hypothetical protein